MPIIVIIFQGWQIRSRTEHMYVCHKRPDGFEAWPDWALLQHSGVLQWSIVLTATLTATKMTMKRRRKITLPKSYGEVIPSRLEIYWWRRWTSALHFSSITLNERLEVEVDREQQVITQPLDFLKILYMVMLPQCYFNKYTIKLVYKQTWGLLEWRQKKLQNAVGERGGGGGQRGWIQRAE